MSYRRKRGLGDVAAPATIWGSAPAGYYPSYAPGVAFSNACRTESNPDGWIKGSGGYSSRPPISAAWYAMSDAAKKSSLESAQMHRETGQFVCPDDIGSAPASPFMPGYVAPSSGSGNTPLFGWSGGYVATPVAPPAATGPQLSFVTSRGGTVLYPGDTWTIKITGAAPNAAVVVVGGKGGAKDQTPMGSTDSAGAFSLSGAISADSAGVWSETWSVGGKVVGSFGFTVQTGTPTTPAGQVIINSSGAPVPVPAPGGPAAAAGFSFASLPWWAWAGVAGVGLYAMNSKGGR